jgi:predicted TIM-barrel fold metal-dependent hydrolase
MLSREGASLKSSVPGLNVDKAVVFGFAFKDMGLCRYANDYVADAIKRFPDKLIGYMILTPTSDEITKEIDRCIDMGLTGIGELMPYGQGFNIDDQKEMSNLSNACIERDLPVIIHTNEAVGHHYCGKTDTTAVKAGALAHNYPDLKVIFAHWGGGLLFYELMPEIRKQNKNVYYDTAASPFLYDKKIYKVAKEIGILDKVLFGSDYPLISMKRYIKDVADTGLSESDQALVNGLNAKALLKL